jgi:hypothetical protein
MNQNFIFRVFFKGIVSQGEKAQCLYLTSPFKQSAHLRKGKVKAHISLDVFCQKTELRISLKKHR